MRLERMLWPSSTTEAAVSSQELSMPRTSMLRLYLLPAPSKPGEARGKRRSSNTDLCDDGRHEFVRRDVECRIENGNSFRDDARVPDMSDLRRCSLLDRNV